MTTILVSGGRGFLVFFLAAFLLNCVQPVKGVDLGEAVNATNLVWTTGGNVSWLVDTNFTHDGVAAARSGAVAQDQESTLDAAITGPGTLTFWRYVSAHSGDSLIVSVNGVEQKRMFVFKDWAQETVSLGSDAHTVRWAFSRNSFDATGYNAGFIDQVSFTPGVTTPDILTPPANHLLSINSNVVLNVSAVGTPPLFYQWRWNGVDITGATTSSLALTNAQLAMEGFYSVSITNAYGSTNAGAYVDVVDFSEALNSTNLVWSTGGDKPWFVQTSTETGKIHDGTASVQSGQVLNNQQSSFQTTVAGPGLITFWSSVEAGINAVLVFSMNGVEKTRTEWSQAWRQTAYYLGEGNHTLVWTFSKNHIYSGISGKAWVDEVIFTPGAVSAPIIISNAVRQSASVDSSATLRVEVGGTPPFTYQWQHNEIAIPNATNVALTLSNIHFLHAGNYRVMVTNQYGSAISTNVELTVLPISSWGAGRTNANTTPNYGQSIIPASATNLVAIAAGGHHSLAVRADGTAVAWGNNTWSQTNVPAAATNLISVSAGLSHSLALRKTGAVHAWGSNQYGQNNIPPAVNNVIAIASGWEHNVALRKDGKVVAWGAGTNSIGGADVGQSMVPTALSNVTAIAAGAFHTLALKSDGTVAAWGLNSMGQTNVPAGLTNVIAIAAGASNSIALKRDRTLVAWGDNRFGQGDIPAGLTNVFAIAAGGNHVMALNGDGSVIAWGQNTNGQTNVPLVLTNVAAIAAGRFHSMALMTPGGISLISQPVSMAVTNGATTNMTVSAIGAAPLSYQWQRNEMDIPGATGTSLLLSDVQLTNEGTYRVVISNLSHAVTTSNAVLSVVDLARALDATNLVWTTTGTTNVRWFPQGMISHDGHAAGTSGSLNFNQYATLQTTVVGPGTLTFWWMLEGNPTASTIYSFFINGTNQATIFPRDGWQQQTLFLSSGNNVLRWISGWGGEGPYSGYLDQVNYMSGASGATLITPPVSKTVPAGTNVTFTVKGGGTPPLRYQWHFAGAELPGATNTSLALVNVQGTNAGTYSVTVSNNYGASTASADLSVLASEPSIWIQPASKEMVRGGTVTFDVTARGTDPLSYQWQFNGEDIVSATLSSLTVSHVQSNHIGSYRVAVSNVYGGRLSSIATLKMVPTVIVGWGSVFTSSPNPPLGITNVAAISGGDDFSVALRNDGTVFAWGWNAFSRLDVPVGLTNVSIVSAGGFHGSTLKKDGTVVNWGNSFFDQAAVVPTGLSNVVDIAAGERFNIGLKQDGTLGVWGNDALGSLRPPNSLNDVVDIAAGSVHGLALRRDGKVVSWGNNNYGTTNVPAGLTNVVAIAGGYFYSAALKSDGTVAAWGSSSVTNAPSGLTNVVALAGGSQHCLALRRDGTVVGWGPNAGAANVPAWLTNVVAVSGGRNHSLALLNDGSPYVIRQPWTQTISSGSTATFAVVVMGESPFAYQWQFNGTNIENATNTVLTLTNVPLAAAGKYHCIVSNSIGIATSLPAELLVIRSVPRFVSEWSGFDNEGNFKLYVTGLSGQGEIVISTSTNLVDWRAAITNPPALGERQFIDPDFPHDSQRFYRVEEK